MCMNIKKNNKNISNVMQLYNYVFYQHCKAKYIRIIKRQNTCKVTFDQLCHDLDSCCQGHNHFVAL